MLGVRQYALCYFYGIAHALNVGWIPLMLPFGLADVFSSTLDYWSFYHTVRITAREYLRNLLIGKI